MAESEKKSKPGRPRGKSDAVKVWFMLPRHHYDYLEHLATVKVRFGTTPNDAAKFLLIRDLAAMFDADFHKKEIPND